MPQSTKRDMSRDPIGACLHGFRPSSRATTARRSFAGSGGRYGGPLAPSMPASLRGQFSELVAHAFVARVLGEDSSEVFARHRLLALREVVLGPLGEGNVADR
jgi:hypothetical protein